MSSSSDIFICLILFADILGLQGPALKHGFYVTAISTTQSNTVEITNMSENSNLTICVQVSDSPSLMYKCTEKINLGKNSNTNTGLRESKNTICSLSLPNSLKQGITLKSPNDSWKQYGDFCNHESELCDPEQNLICYNAKQNRKQIGNGTQAISDEDSNNFFKYYDGTCRCYKGWVRTGHKCHNSDVCAYLDGMTCVLTESSDLNSYLETGYCHCKPTMIHNGKKCLVKAGFHCDDDTTCVDHAVCNNGTNLCECHQPNYIKGRGQLCYKSFGKKCSPSDVSSNKCYASLGLRCNETTGRCECTSGETWSETLALCVSLVGSDCKRNKRCVQSATCSLSTQTCFCENNYTETSQGICKLDFGAACNVSDTDRTEGTNPCNHDKNLVCIHGVCKCATFEGRMYQNGQCVGIDGAYCGYLGAKLNDSRYFGCGRGMICFQGKCSRDLSNPVSYNQKIPSIAIEIPPSFNDSNDPADSSVSANILSNSLSNDVILSLVLFFNVFTID